MSKGSCSSAEGAVTRKPPKPTPHFIVSVARGPEMAKLRSLTELCSFRVSVETYIAPNRPLQFKRCQRFCRTQRYCGYAPRCVACGEAHLSGECPHLNSRSLSAAAVEETTQPTTGAVWNGRRLRRCLLSGRLLNAVRGAEHPALLPFRRRNGRSRPLSRRVWNHIVH